MYSVKISLLTPAAHQTIIVGKTTNLNKQIVSQEEKWSIRVSQKIYVTYFSKHILLWNRLFLNQLMSTKIGHILRTAQIILLSISHPTSEGFYYTIWTRYKLTILHFDGYDISSPTTSVILRCVGFWKSTNNLSKGIFRQSSMHVLYAQ